MAHTFDDVIKLENLCLAWQEFILGKKKKRDVLQFSNSLMDNIVALHEDLASPAPQGCGAGHTYQHGGYEDFYVNDPKRRHIHKASVRDRLLHHAIYRVLYPFFDKIFIADSFSCRNNKGMHKALNRFREMFYEVSKNNTHTCWVLKCDIKKFFDSIDHQVLLNILSEYIPDRDIMNLLEKVIESYQTTSSPTATSEPSLLRKEGTVTGLPLGNLTPQLFSNIYLNVFDQFVKHKLKTKHYIRYADDFVFLSTDKKYLKNLMPEIKKFLSEKLKLTLHPQKVFLQTGASGVDFLGWKHFNNHRLLRKTTRKRMFGRMTVSLTSGTLQSYLGLLKHGNTQKVREELLSWWWLYKE